MFRLISLPTGQRLINLAKVSVVELQGKEITYVMDRSPVKSSLFSNTPLEHSSGVYLALYQTAEQAQQDFNAIKQDLFLKQEK